MNETIECVNSLFAQAPKESRKEFALWVTKNHKDKSSYLFAMMDGKDILPIIYRLEFQNHRDEKVLNQTEGVA